jgi:hypothetical protein
MISLMTSKAWPIPLFTHQNHTTRLSRDNPSEFFNDTDRTSSGSSSQAKPSQAKPSQAKPSEETALGATSADSWRGKVSG